MKQCTSDKALRYNSKATTTSFNEDEIEVADILLDLTNLITKSESNRRRGDDFPVGWGIRKRRSVPSSPHRVVEIQGTIKTPNKVRVESTSPLTPLSFYQSESDEKSKLTLKNNNTKKRTREEWLEIIDGLTRSRELLRREVDNERSRRNKLKSFNLALKVKKNEANSLCLRKEKTELGMDKRRRLDIIELKVDQNPMFAPQQQLIINRVIYESQEASGGRFQYPNHHHHRAQFLLPSNGGGGGGGGLSSGAVNHVGPLGIPDLNISFVEEEAFGLGSCQPLDQQQSRVLVDARVMCAEARRRRMIKIKEMKKQQQQRVR